jgi:hypothetical protein
MENIYTLASQNGIKISTVKQESGIAKEWDFRAESVILQQTSQAAQSLEYKIIDLFSQYLSQSIDYQVVYPSQFSPSYDSDRTRLILDALDRVTPQPVTDALWIEFVKQFWKNAPDRADEIREALESQQQQQLPIV